ncbi:TIGR02680 family protein [Virgibacillus pantothenticus]|uniref:TIGR02680 family protein n=2 Tax=Virgibacillus pantothenticus TaxID=1473 RepID=UPI0025AF1CDE|nr:TIGR02680 family protein [Virgibacillus pantothenticus]
MSKNKWQLHRAGLLNFWYYDDEFFEFADGKLLLRGSNGSGKSVTMQSILPVLLDGKKSPDRLDPFGSKARKMEDYLLGEKDIVDRDERTGYLFIEYKRQHTDQYMTTGIGMQARRHKTMNTWYFMITDNRRINEDLLLYETERHAGETQQIPLSRVQLENRIGDGGHVVRTQTEYMQLVNKYIFGFEEIDAFEDLIKLLIQLRSPKLSKDFKPTVIYEILEAALPPLTDEDLRHLSDTIEHMDQTKQQIEQLEREQEALNKLIRRYDDYNTYMITAAAHEYMETKQQYTRKANVLEEKKREVEKLEAAILNLYERNRTLEQEKDILEKKQERLRHHKVWNLEKDLTNEQQTLEEIDADMTRKQNQVSEKKRLELRTEDNISTLEAEITDVEETMDDELEDLQLAAEEASFMQHDINEQDFKRHQMEKFDFTVWRQEAEAHYQLLDTITDEVRTYEQLQQQLVDFQKKLADSSLQLDTIRQEEKDWRNVFEEEKQEKLSEIYQWVETNAFLPIDEEILQKTAREIDQLYGENTYEDIRQLFVKKSTSYQMNKNEVIATHKGNLSFVQEELKHKKAELTSWQTKRDPEPPYQKEATKHARMQLKEKGYAFAPFYEVVEFQDHVPEALRKQLEAILLDANILDSLMAENGIPLANDRIITPQPQMMAHTLADYLKPDIDPEQSLPEQLVDDVLRSILVEEELQTESFSFNEDGKYRIGLVEGHTSSVDAVRYIGKNARKRYREEMIAQLQEDIEGLQHQINEVNKKIRDLEASVLAAQEAMKQFPDDADLQVSYTKMKEKQFEGKQLQKELERIDAEMQATNQVYQEKKRLLDEKTRELNITFSLEGYLEAKKEMRRYEKTLSSLVTAHTTFLLQQESMIQTRERLAQIIVEVDELNGELNVVADKKAKVKGNMKEIERQLDRHGVADIRKQIQEVQQSLKQTEKEHLEIQVNIPKKEANRDMLTQQIQEEKQQLSFLEKMIEAWQDTFVQEIHYQFISFPETYETNEDRAKWVLKTYKHWLKEKNLTTIEGQLTSVYYEQHSNLMEYRMSDVQVQAEHYPWMEEEWKDDQRLKIQYWKEKATRRLIQLDYQGKRVDPYVVREKIENDCLQQQHLLDDQDRKLYEEILFDSVGKKLRSRISRAQQWTEKMDKLMAASDSSSGLSFSIKWKPRTAETEVELDTKELVDLLRRDSRLLKEEDMLKVIEHFRSRIARAKELVEIKGEGSTLLQVLKDVLDYRNWFSFVLSYKRTGEPKRELSNHAFYQFSGGEKAMAMYIPLFTACYSRYLEAADTAPYIITLDEAFAGVDEDNISVMFRLVEELGFNYMMNSQVLWGDYETISNLAIYELVRPKNQDFVTVIRYHWDGNKRSLVVNDMIDKKTNTMNV